MRDAPSYYRQMKDRLIIELAPQFCDDVKALMDRVDRIMAMRGEQAERDQLAALEARRKEVQARKDARKQKDAD